MDVDEILKELEELLYTIDKDIKDNNKLELIPYKLKIENIINKINTKGDTK